MYLCSERQIAHYIFAIPFNTNPLKLLRELIQYLQLLTYLITSYLIIARENTININPLIFTRIQSTISLNYNNKVSYKTRLYIL